MHSESHLREESLNSEGQNERVKSDWSKAVKLHNTTASKDLIKVSLATKPRLGSY